MYILSHRVSVYTRFKEKKGRKQDIKEGFGKHSGHSLLLLRAREERERGIHSDPAQSKIKPFIIGIGTRRQ